MAVMVVKLLQVVYVYGEEVCFFYFFIFFIFYIYIKESFDELEILGLPVRIEPMP